MSKSKGNILDPIEIIKNYHNIEIKSYKTLIGMSWDSENELLSKATHKATISVNLYPFQQRKKKAFDIQKELEIPNNNKNMTDITFVANANLPMFIVFFKLEVIVVPKTAPIPALDNKIPYI